MIKDKIKLDQDFGDFDQKCSLCHRKNHFSAECENFHYHPYKDFLIKKYIYSTDQSRKIFKLHRSNRRFHALIDNFLVQCSCLKYNGVLDEEENKTNESDEEQTNNEVENNPKFNLGRRKSLF